MKKTHFRNNEYFSKNRNFNEDALLEYAAVFNDKATKELHRKRLSYSMYFKSVELLVLGYSCYEPSEKLLKRLTNVCHYSKQYLAQYERSSFEIESTSDFSLITWVISIAILLDVEDDLFDELVRLLVFQSGDIFLKALVNLKKQVDMKAEQFLFPKQYEKLYEILLTKEPIKIAQYLEKKYYTSFKNTYWYDTHLKDDSGFFGYWSFEIAAFVKKMGIDDWLFRNSIYYPERLA